MFVVMFTVYKKPKALAGWYSIWTDGGYLWEYPSVV